MDNLVQQLDDMVAQLRVKTDCTTSGANALLHAAEPEVLSTLSVASRPARPSLPTPPPYIVVGGLGQCVWRYRRFLAVALILWIAMLLTEQAAERLLQQKPTIGRPRTVWQRVQRQGIVAAGAAISTILVLWVMDRVMR